MIAITAASHISQFDVNSYYSLYLSLVINRNLPSVSFSPESGGNVKPSSAIEDMRTQGTIRLKK